jgi:hypothetical protein
MIARVMIKAVCMLYVVKWIWRMSTIMPAAVLKLHLVNENEICLFFLIVEFLSQVTKYKMVDCYLKLEPEGPKLHQISFVDIPETAHRRNFTCTYCTRGLSEYIP